MHLTVCGNISPCVRPLQVQSTASSASCGRACTQLRRGSPVRRRTVGALQALSANGVSDSTDIEPSSLRVNLSAFPDVDFFKVEAVLRPWRLSDVIHELSANGILGMTATNVKGAGVQGGAKQKGFSSNTPLATADGFWTRERYKGTEHGLTNLVEKSKLEVVCFRTQVNRVVRTICSAAGTGYVGDGKIFVSPVADVVRIRTLETGTNAERMEGGMHNDHFASIDHE